MLCEVQHLIVFRRNRLISLLFLLYHYAYKNSRTGFLTYMMYARLLDCMRIVGGLHADPIQGFEMLSNCFATVELFLALGWLALNFQLRKINIRNRLPFLSFQQ